MAATKAKKPKAKLKAGKKKGINNWLILSGVAAVAVVGALVVRFSGAGGYPFVRYAQSMSYENKTAKQTFVRSGRTYVKFTDQYVRTIASKTEISKSKKLCAHVINTGNSSAKFYISQMYLVGSNPRETGQIGSATIAAGKTGNVCTARSRIDNAIISVSTQFTYSGGVDTVYGTY